MFSWFNKSSGNMAWSSTTETLLVWNLANGLDVYRLADKPIRTGMLKLKIKQNFVIQVAFGGQGKYAISGSDNGEVYLWDFESTQPTQILSGDSGEFLQFRIQKLLSFDTKRYSCHTNCHRSSDSSLYSVIITNWLAKSITRSNMTSPTLPVHHRIHMIRTLQSIYGLQWWYIFAYDLELFVKTCSQQKPKTTTQPPPRPNRMPSLTWVFGILQGLSLLFIFAWFSGSLPLH